MFKSWTSDWFYFVISRQSIGYVTVVAMEIGCVISIVDGSCDSDVNNVHLLDN